MPAVPLSRRLLLGGAAALVLTGCEDDAGTGRDDRPAPGPDSPTGSPSTSGSPSDPDEALVERLLADTSALVAAYEELGSRHRRVRPVTAPLLAHLGEHLVAFGGDTRTIRPVRVDRSLAVAIREVLSVERAAARRRAADAGVAVSGELARTLASVAGAHAQHAVVLEGLLP